MVDALAAIESAADDHLQSVLDNDDKRADQ
jgi:hypothetical protein